MLLLHVPILLDPDARRLPARCPHLVVEAVNGKSPSCSAYAALSALETTTAQPASDSRQYD